MKSSFYQEKIIVEILSMSQKGLRRVVFNSDEPELEIHAPRDDELIPVEQAQKMVVEQAQEVVVDQVRKAVVTMQLELSLVGSTVPTTSVKLLSSSILPYQEVAIRQDNEPSGQVAPGLNRIVTLPRRWPLAPVKPVMEMLRKNNVRKKTY